MKVGSVTVGGGRADRRAIHDEHRHRGCRGHTWRRSQHSRAQARRSCASQWIATRPRPLCRISRDGLAKKGLDVPLVGDFPLYRPQAARRASRLCRGARKVPHQSRQWSVSRTRRTGSSARLSRWPSATTRPCALALTGARSIRNFHRPDGRECPQRRSAEASDVMREAMVQSALLSAERAEEIGLRRNQIILSAKVSAVQDLITHVPHAGGTFGIRDPSRPDGSRHGLEGDCRILGCLGRPAAGGHRRYDSLLADTRTGRGSHARGERPRRNCCRPWVSAPSCRWLPPAPAAGAPPPPCPGTGPRHPTWISTSMPDWKSQYPGVEGLKVAVMGCIVNGPGESKHADIGISLPRHGRNTRRPRLQSTDRRP